MLNEKIILANMAFLKKCELDYQQLADRLIKELAIQLHVVIDFKLPIKTFKPFYTSAQSGQMHEWYYFFHGHHCYFENTLTQQKIEVSLVNGKNFGTLDPLFFSLYILSSKSYEPLPIKISESFTEGKAILKALKSIKKQK